MNPKFEVSNGTTVFVCSKEHTFIQHSYCPAIAISSYVHELGNIDEVGFECSHEAVNVRRAMVDHCFAFEGHQNRSIAPSDTVYFNPQGESINFTAKVVSQPVGQMGAIDGQFKPPSKFLKRATEVLVDRKYLHRDPKLAAELADLHVEHGLEMQYWPYLTPYESVCYFYGRDQEKLLKQVRSFFEKQGVVHRELEGMYFPVY